jgi:CheY-like chemotaxis protein
MRVLLAEDNVVNQRVAARLLTKRGHRVTVANNGVEALDALERAVFDIVLMDVQMPVMGGFEATAAIRERERRQGGHLRIVAMTAHALKGDRERCLAAGMDGYLPKPIDRLDLFAAVEEGAPMPVTATGSDDAPAFDVENARQRFGGDEHLLAEIARVFLEDCPRQRRAIDAAIDAGDAEGLAAAAHALKGAAASLSAPRVADAARVLEILGRDGPMADAPAARQRLRREIDGLTTTLNQLLAEGTQCAS